MLMWLRKRNFTFCAASALIGQLPLYGGLNAGFNIGGGK